MIVPLILTCGRNVSFFRSFVESYRTVAAAFAKPVVVMDTSDSSRLSTEYLKLLVSLRPQSTHVHPREPGLSVYDSVQHASHFALERALNETDADTILFLEDDIVFSPRFVDAVSSYDLRKDAGFATFYIPENEYGGTVVDPSRFYGTQCVLFRRSVVRELVDNFAEMQEKYPPGYDLRWSRFLAARGYTIYATEHSYVQHIGVISRLDGIPSHGSKRFYDEAFFARHETWRGEYDAVADAFASLVTFDSVLDLGCGNGFLPEFENFSRFQAPGVSSFGGLRGSWAPKA